uniref:Uncharacterized protein n=1 Tax=Lepeophtheirus salmonis TaxID=72036 RepID=A0A0K2VFL5_LEPSM
MELQISLNLSSGQTKIFFIVNSKQQEKRGKKETKVSKKHHTQKL